MSVDPSDNEIITPKPPAPDKDKMIEDWIRKPRLDDDPPTPDEYM